MKALPFLLIMLGVFSDPSDWEISPGELLITSASMWNVNQADPVTADDIALYFKNAQFSKHKIIPGLNVLVFDQTLAMTKEKGDVARMTLPPVKTDGLNDDQIRASALSMDATQFISHLAALNAKFPSADFTSVNIEKNALEIVAASQADGDFSQWYLHGHSALENEKKLGFDPPSDRSILIQWGHKDKIKTIRSSLFKHNHDAQGRPLTEVDDGGVKSVLDPRKVYDLHFNKVAFSVTLNTSSAGDVPGKESSELKKVIPLYVVAAKQQTKGYLLFYTTGEATKDAPAEKGDDQGIQKKLVILEIPEFHIKKSDKKEDKSDYFDFQIPAQPFLDLVLKKLVKEPTVRRDLSYYFNANSWGPFVTTKELTMIQLKQMPVVLDNDETRRDAQIEQSKVRVLLTTASKERGLLQQTSTYSVVFARADDADLNLKETTPKEVYNLKGELLGSVSGEAKNEPAKLEQLIEKKP